MAHVDNLKPATHDDLKALANKHGSFEDFMHDLEVLGEKMWHNARSQKETDAQQKDIDEKTAARNDLASEGGDADGSGTPSNTDENGNEPAEGAQVVAGPTDDGEQVSQPAEPASPVSDAGFPTSNVDVVEAPVNVVAPSESHPA